MIERTEITLSFYICCEKGVSQTADDIIVCNVNYIELYNYIQLYIQCIVMVSEIIFLLKIRIASLRKTPVRFMTTDGVTYRCASTAQSFRPFTSFDI